MSRRFGSFRWLATQSVVTRTSGCAYSVMRNSSSREYQFERTIPLRAPSRRRAPRPAKQRGEREARAMATARNACTHAFRAEGLPSRSGRLSRFESAAPCLEFYSNNSVVVNPCVAAPFFERVSIGRVEFDQHFAFDHVYLHAPHGDAVRR